MQGAGRAPRQNTKGRGGDSENLPDNGHSGGIHEKPREGGEGHHVHFVRLDE